MTQPRLARCKAITALGKRCSFSELLDGLCGIHRRKLGRPAASTQPPRIGAHTRTRGANLQPGGREPVRPGDRWLIARRGDAQPWAGVALKPEGRGAWRFAQEGSRIQCRVGPEALVRLLGPASYPELRDDLARELAALRREVGRLAEAVDRLGPPRKG